MTNPQALLHDLEVSVVFSLKQIRTALAALLLIAVTTPVPAATPEPAVSEAAIVPLFPQKERDLKKGLPPGMTAVSSGPATVWPKSPNWRTVRSSPSSISKA